MRALRTEVVKHMFVRPDKKLAMFTEAETPIFWNNPNESN
jgi:hypothetical protein